MDGDRVCGEPITESGHWLLNRLECIPFVNPAAREKISELLYSDVTAFGEAFGAISPRPHLLLVFRLMLFTGFTFSVQGNEVTAYYY